jgi:hypothetical protein
VELIRNCRARLSDLAEAEGIDIPDICRFETRMRVWLEQKQKALESINRLAGIANEVKVLKRELEDIFKAEMGKFSIACPYDRNDPNLGGPKDKWEREASHMVPTRSYRGPIQLRGPMEKLSRDEREWFHEFSKKHPKATGASAVYWTDGKRTLLEIADLVEAENGERDVEGLVGYFRFLKRLKLIEIQRM